MRAMKTPIAGPTRDMEMPIAGSTSARETMVSHDKDVKMEPVPPGPTATEEVQA